MHVDLKLVVIISTFGVSNLIFPYRISSPSFSFRDYFLFVFQYLTICVSILFLLTLSPVCCFHLKNIFADWLDQVNPIRWTVNCGTKRWIIENCPYSWKWSTNYERMPQMWYRLPIEHIAIHSKYESWLDSSIVWALLWLSMLLMLLHCK